MIAALPMLVTCTKSGGKHLQRASPAAQQARTIHGPRRLQTVRRGPKDPAAGQVLQSECLPTSAWRLLWPAVPPVAMLLAYAENVAAAMLRA